MIHLFVSQTEILNIYVDEPGEILMSSLKLQSHVFRESPLKNSHVLARRRKTLHVPRLRMPKILCHEAETRSPFTHTRISKTYLLNFINSERREALQVYVRGLRAKLQGKRKPENPY